MSAKRLRSSSVIAKKPAAKSCDCGVAKKPACSRGSIPDSFDASLIVDISTFLTAKKLGLFSATSRLHAATTASIRSDYFWKYASCVASAIADELLKGRSSLEARDPDDPNYLRAHRNSEYANMCKHFRRAVKLAESLYKVLNWSSKSLWVVFDLERIELYLEFVMLLPTSPGQQGHCLETAAYLDCDGSEDNYYAAFHRIASFCSAVESVKMEQVRQHLSTLQLAQLRQELSIHGLRKSGGKSEIIDRLLDYLFKTKVVGISSRLNA